MHEPKRPVLPSAFKSAKSQTTARVSKASQPGSTPKSSVSPRQPTSRGTLQGLGPVVVRGSGGVAVQAPKPTSVATALADITADILTPASSGSIRATLKMKAQSFSSLLAADRKAPRSTLRMLAHPWFSSPPADDSFEIWEAEEPDLALLLGASVALLTALELLFVSLLFV